MSDVRGRPGQIVRILYPVVLAILAFAVIPNVPYHYWLNRLSPTRAVMNVDYLVLGVFSRFLSPLAITVLFILISVVDGFVFISTLYHFTPRELVMSMSYARYSPVTIFDLPIIDIVLMTITLTIAILLARRVAAARRTSVSLVMAGLIVLVAIADIANGSNTYGPFTRLPFFTRIQHVSMNPVNSGIYAVDPAAFLPFASTPVVTRTDSASAAGLRQWRTLARGGVPDANLALVLIESWGQIGTDDTLTRAIAAPLFTPAIAARYDVRIGQVRFHGSTTNAELRELCGVQTSYRDLFDLPRFPCLPDRMTALGYTVTGMHGFHGDMFDRTSWWPRIGIQRSVFLDDFRKTGHDRTCGTAFPGLCDDELITAAADRLTVARQFVYALTINSHLPLARVPDAAGGVRCEALPIPLRDESCGLAQLWHRIFVAIAANAMRADVKPTEFIIVGDHSPPLLGVAARGFSSTAVPYILMTPRRSAGKPAR